MAKFHTFKLKNWNSKYVAAIECLSDQCVCVSAGGNTCNENNAPIECKKDRCIESSMCSGYGYWCKDSGIAKDMRFVCSTLMIYVLVYKYISNHLFKE